MPRRLTALFAALLVLAPVLAATSQARPTASARSQNACAISQDHSLVGTEVAHITWVNKTTAAVKIEWLSYQGQRVFYESVAAGQSFTQTTWATHPWVVLAPDGRCIGYTIATTTPQTYVITDGGGVPVDKKKKGNTCRAKHEVIFSVRDGKFKTPSLGQCLTTSRPTASAPLHSTSPAILHCNIDRSPGDATWAFNDFDRTASGARSEAGANLTSCLNALPARLAGVKGVAFFALSSTSRGVWSGTAGLSTAASKHFRSKLLELYYDKETVNTTAFNAWRRKSKSYGAVVNIGAADSDRDVALWVWRTCRATASGKPLALYAGTHDPDKASIEGSWSNKPRLLAIHWALHECVYGQSFSMHGVA